MESVTSDPLRVAGLEDVEGTSLVRLWEADQDLAGSVLTIDEGLKGFLDFAQWKGVSDQGLDVDSSLADPLHGKREIARKIGTYTGGQGEILEKEIVPTNPIDQC